ncbi:MAG: hypothetical protein JWO68_2050, partial [Actinomycetia bacterium]|nr:hypothetical protein [Actinomycetes bacterium]
MNDTLTDDLRRALHERADEIPEGPAPGLVLGYTAPTPSRSRRVPLAVAGTIAAGLLAVALVAGRDGGGPVTDPTVATTAQAPAGNTTELPAAPHQETDGTFAGFTATNDNPVIWSFIAEGTIGGTRWQLIAAQQDGKRRVGLFADGIEGTFSIDPGPVPADAPAVLQIGPCCRLGTHTIVVAVVSP